MVGFTSPQHALSKELMDDEDDDDRDEEELRLLLMLDDELSTELDDRELDDGELDSLSLLELTDELELLVRQQQGIPAIIYEQVVPSPP